MIVFCPAALTAEAADAGRIEGRVTDAKGQAIVSANVQLVDNRGFVVEEVDCGADGSFPLTNLAPGNYVVLARVEGRIAPQQRVAVSAGETHPLAVQFGTGARRVRSSEEIEWQILAMQTQLTQMQKQLSALAEERRIAKRLEGEPRLSGEEEPNDEVLIASLNAGPAMASPQTPQQSPGGLYEALKPEAGQTPEAPAPAETRERSGAGYTNRGLYGGLAPGAEGKRYSRGLFGDIVKIGGYGSFRFEANNIPDGPRIGDLPPLKFGHNNFDFRRLVLTMDAAPSKRLRFYSEIEFERLNEIEIERNAIPENRGRADRDRRGTRFIQEVEGTSGGEIALEQAWGQFNFNDNIGIRGGVVLPPVGRFNIVHDDVYWDIPRRTLVDRGGPVLPTKAAWREVASAASSANRSQTATWMRRFTWSTARSWTSRWRRSFRCGMAGTCWSWSRKSPSRPEPSTAARQRRG